VFKCFSITHRFYKYSLILFNALGGFEEVQDLRSTLQINKAIHVARELRVGTRIRRQKMVTSY
jgi:hypothetical protein